MSNLRYLLGSMIVNEAMRRFLIEECNHKPEQFKLIFKKEM